MKKASFLTEVILFYFVAFVSVCVGNPVPAKAIWKGVVSIEFFIFKNFNPHQENFKKDLFMLHFLMTSKIFSH